MLKLAQLNEHIPSLKSHAACFNGSFHNHNNFKFFFCDIRSSHVIKR